MEEEANVGMSRPLASIALHEPERVGGKGSFTYEALEMFIKNKCPQYAGLSIDRWLELPVHIASSILEICSNTLDAEAKAISSLTQK